MLTPNSNLLTWYKYAAMSLHHKINYKGLMFDQTFRRNDPFLGRGSKYGIALQIPENLLKFTKKQDYISKVP